MVTTNLGKIAHVSFGLGGYQDCCIGLHITLEGQGWGTCTSKDAWDKNLITWSNSCKWTEQSRLDQYAEIMCYLSDLLFKAKKLSVDQLKGVPVEAVFENNTLKSWRILEEVL